MTREEIMALDIEQIDKRNAEIVDELREADAEGIERLNDELDAIRERREVIKLEVEQRKLDMAAVIKGQGDVIEEVKDERKVNTMEMRNTPEYINAYAEYIKSGNDMECRKLTREHKIDFISTVDIAHLDGLVTEIIIFNSEESADFQQFIMKIHTLLLSVILRKYPLFVS